MRFVYGFATLLLAVICATFAVSNRGMVAVSLWPFSGSLDLPLYALALGTAVAGLIIGLAIGWASGIPIRLARRRIAQRLATAEAELKRLKAQATEPTVAVPAGVPAKVDA